MIYHSYGYLIWAVLWQQVYRNTCPNNVYAYYFSHIITFIIFISVMHVTSFVSAPPNISTQFFLLWKKRPSRRTGEPVGKDAADTTFLAKIHHNPRGAAPCRTCIDAPLYMLPLSKWREIKSSSDILILWTAWPDPPCLQECAFMTHGNRVPMSRSIHWVPSDVWSVIQMLTLLGEGASFKIGWPSKARAGGVLGIVQARPDLLLEPWVWAVPAGYHRSWAWVCLPGEGSSQLSSEAEGLALLCVLVIPF